MPEAYIVATARTAGGERGGKLKDWHPTDLAAQVIDALVERVGADPAQIEDVILGCVQQVGEQGLNVARNAVLSSKLPESVPGDQSGPAMRIVPAGAAFRGASGDVRHHGYCDCRRRGVHDARADGTFQPIAGEERLWQGKKARRRKFVIQACNSANSPARK